MVQREKEPGRVIKRRRRPADLGRDPGKRTGERGSRGNWSGQRGRRTRKVQNHRLEEKVCPRQGTSWKIRSRKLGRHRVLGLEGPLEITPSSSQLLPPCLLQTDLPAHTLIPTSRPLLMLFLSLNRKATAKEQESQ